MHKILVGKAKLFFSCSQRRSYAVSLAREEVALGWSPVALGFSAWMKKSSSPRDQTYFNILLPSTVILQCTVTLVCNCLLYSASSMLLLMNWEESKSSVIRSLPYVTILLSILRWQQTLPNNEHCETSSRSSCCHETWFFCIHFTRGFTCDK